MVKSNPGSYDNMMRLLRIARGLEAGGFYNAAKLFWALAYSDEVRAINHLGIPTDPVDLDSEIEIAIQALKSNGISQGLVSAIKRGQHAARVNQAIPASDIPPVYVCRVCGEVLLSESPMGDMPDQCPECGAWELTFREFPPIYYLEPMHPRVVMDALESAPRVVEAAVFGLTESQMSQALKPGEWSIREVLHHLLVTQELLGGRVERMLAEENPLLKGVVAWADKDEATLSVMAMLEHYRKSRLVTVNNLRGMPVESWWRTAQHEEFGSVTILQQVSYFAKHERSHLPQIASIRKSFGS
jgi:hypothetical protein